MCFLYPNYSLYVSRLSILFIVILYPYDVLLFVFMVCHIVCGLLFVGMGSKFKCSSEVQGDLEYLSLQYQVRRYDVRDGIESMTGFLKKSTISLPVIEQNGEFLFECFEKVYNFSISDGIVFKEFVENLVLFPSYNYYSILSKKKNFNSPISPHQWWYLPQEIWKS